MTTGKSGQSDRLIPAIGGHRSVAGPNPAGPTPPLPRTGCAGSLAAGVSLRSGGYQKNQRYLFLGQIFTRAERAKGGTNSYIKHPELNVLRARSLVHSSEVQRATRYVQLEYEEGIANELRAKGWMVFSPTVVCDRVGVKGDKAFFLRFKRTGQIL